MSQTPFGRMVSKKQKEYYWVLVLGCCFGKGESVFLQAPNSKWQGWRHDFVLLAIVQSHNMTKLVKEDSKEVSFSKSWAAGKGL